MARNSKLTPLVQERIVRAILSGNYNETAANYAGICEKTFYDWLKRGESAPESKFGEFRRAVKEAEAASEVEAVALIRLQARDCWQAAMTWLERKYPRRWGRFDRQEHSGEVSIRMIDETSDSVESDLVSNRRVT